MKERKDFIKIKAREGSGLGGMYGSNYEYDFRGGGAIELPRSLFESPRFDSIRDRLEVVEDPVIVADEITSPSTRPPRRARSGSIPHSGIEEA